MSKSDRPKHNKTENNEIKGTKTIGSILAGLSREDKTVICIYTVVALICLLPLLCDKITGKHYRSYIASDTLSVDGGEAEVKGYSGVMQGKVFEQSITCNCYSIASITLHAYDFLSRAGGDFRVELADDTGSVLEAWDTKIADIDDDGVFVLKVPDPSKRLDMMDRELRIRIFTDTPAKKASLSMAGADNCYDGGALYIDGKDSGADLLFSINGISRILYNDHVDVWLHIYLLVGLEYAAYRIIKVIKRRRSVGEA